MRYGSFGSFGFSSGGFASFGPSSTGVWNLDYSSTASGGSGDEGGFWGDLGDSITDFLGGGKSGQVIEEGGDAAVAGAIAKGFDELYDALGIDSSEQNQPSGNESSDDSAASSGKMQIPSWAAPVGIVVVTLFVVEFVTS